MLLTAAAAGAEKLPWKIGIATADITPTKPLWMAGFAARKLAGEAEPGQRIFVKALSLDDGSGKKSVLVTSDLLGFTRDVAAAIASDVQKKYGIPRERLLLNSSHTHAGPVIDNCLGVAYDLPPQYWVDVEAYTKELVAKVSDAVGASLKKTRPATIRFGHSTTDFAKNRRLALNPNGPVDHDVPFFNVADAGGKTIAVVFGYACHNTTISPEHLHFNGDYAGYAQAAIEKQQPGAVAFFVMGCGADINPLPRGTVEHARTYGEKLATAVVSKLSSGRPVAGPLRTAFGIAAIRFATPPTKEELIARLKDPNEYVRRHARLLLRKLSLEGKLDETYPDPVAVWQFGSDLTFIAMGGEVVLDYAIHLKAQYGADRVWVAGYSNDVFGYVPSLRVLKEGGYEGGGAMMYYGATGPFHETVEDTIYKRVDELVKQTGGAAQR